MIDKKSRDTIILHVTPNKLSIALAVFNSIFLII